MTEPHDIAVIGAGVVGVSTALHLAMRGMKVALIDRRGVGQETSYGNAGILNASFILPYPFPPLSTIPAILMGRDLSARLHLPSLPRCLPWLLSFYINSMPKARRRNGVALWPLIRRSIEGHRHLMQETDAGKYLNNEGGFLVYRSDRSFAKDEPMFRVLREEKIPFEILDTGDFAAMEPDIKPVYRHILRWTANRHLSNPGAVVNAYAERFKRGGGTFIRAEAKILEAGDDGWRIKTDGADITARQIVVCGGPWTNRIVRPLGYKFPLACKRGYHRHFAPLNGARLGNYLFDADYSYVLAPMEQGLRLTTAAELADLDAPKTPVQMEPTLKHARDLFPIGEAVEAEPWMGNRPCLPDSLPVIGPAARHAGLWFNFGHGHQGMTLGPASGRLLAEMMTGAAPFCDPQPYRAGRF